MQVFHGCEQDREAEYDRCCLDGAENRRMRSDAARKALSGAPADRLYLSMIVIFKCYFVTMHLLLLESVKISSIWVLHYKKYIHVHYKFLKKVVK